MERNVVDAGNSGQFFKYVNRKLGRSYNIGILKNSDGSDVTTDVGKANLLNSFFSSVNTQDNGVQLTFPPRVEDGIKLETIRFTPDALIRACKKVKPTVSSLLARTVTRRIY